jgi:tetratricopeptide (TPR) repeat protein
MIERRPDADRMQAVGVNVFELRAGIRARDSIPPPPGLALRIGRKARLALALTSEFFARKRPVLRSSAERLFHLSIAMVAALDRGARATRYRIGIARRLIHFDRARRERPRAPEPEPTPVTDDGDRDDPILRQALLRLATREYAYGAHHPNVASELHFIGALHHEAGRYDEALAYYGLALSIREHRLSPDHPELASTLEDLAATRQAQGEAAEAERLLARAKHLRLHYRRLKAPLTTVAEDLPGTH